jgi:hypothetical protein
VALSGGATAVGFGVRRRLARERRGGGDEIDAVEPLDKANNVTFVLLRLALTAVPALVADVEAKAIFTPAARARAAPIDLAPEINPTSP